MTTKSEEKFFKCFGIEPKVISAPNYHWEDYVLEYPQITDRFLLDLICVINRFDIYFDYYYQEEYQVLRETILEDSINLNCKLKQTDFSKLKQQVQALFEVNKR